MAEYKSFYRCPRCGGEMRTSTYCQYCDRNIEGEVAVEEIKEVDNRTPEEKKAESRFNKKILPLSILIGLALAVLFAFLMRQYWEFAKSDGGIFVSIVLALIGGGICINLSYHILRWLIRRD